MKMYKENVMTYHPDLSRRDNSKFLYIGWLDSQHQYPVGTVSEKFIARLWEFCRYSVTECLGRHYCEFCPRVIINKQILPFGEFIQFEILKIHRDGITIKPGDGEIIVLGKNNNVYYAPNLIYHYVVDHSYLPPEEFIQAVLTCPLPTSDEYKKIAASRSWKFTDIGEV